MELEWHNIFRTYPGISLLRLKLLDSKSPELEFGGAHLKITNDTALKQYELALGQIVVNLHSLEFLLRLFLHNVDKKRYGTSPPQVGLNEINVGAKVVENYFTNYDSLVKLIKSYNNLIEKLGKKELIIDEKPVLLRDALAHGRVIGQRPKPPPRLYKFGKPTESGVPVIDIIDFTDAWLQENRGCVHEAFMKVKQACDSFSPITVD